jgi:ADP-ribose pyrophosphatase YjhB (NUDIX family)
MSTDHAPQDPARIAMELSAIAESALAYCRDPFDIERFHRIGALATQLAQTVSTTPLEEYRREVTSVAGYTTPKLDVRAGIFDERGRVLLVREIADDHRWTLPGGWCDVLETPRLAIERECLEEVGIEVRATHLAGVLDREQWPHEPPYDRHIYKLFFVCEALQEVDPDFRSGETSQVGWFDVEDLPRLSLERVVPEQIALLHRHWREPGAAHVD